MWEFWVFSLRTAGRDWPLLIVALGAVFSLPTTGQAVTPDSPEVKALVEKGLGFLETADDERLGAKCLIGLSFFKAGKPVNHPKIVAAINACQSFVAQLGGDGSAVDNYSVGLALI